MNIYDNSTITLQHGKLFNDRKNKTYVSEGYENKISQKINSDKVQNSINRELVQTYNSTLEKYNNVKDNILLQAQNYISRTSQSNPYLNKIIFFNSAKNKNAYFYVTNKGIAKWFPSNEIYNSVLGKNGCPKVSDIIKINIPWSKEYTYEGSAIPTIPPLIVGTSMTLNQSCGNEGNNIYANKMSNNTSTTYQGCFRDDAIHPLMTFIGGSVPAIPSISQIINGTFSQPSLQNDSYKYINSASSVPGWVFNATLINNSSAWEFIKPYPFGSQCVSIRKTQTISQRIKFNSGTYNISFYACGRNCCDGSGTSNPINVQFNGITISTVTPPVTSWTMYKIPFNVTANGNNTIMFLGTSGSSDRSTAIQNIRITLTTSLNEPVGSYSYETCKNTAVDGGYQYFALQSVNPTSETGYCAVSNDIIAPTKNGPAFIVSAGVMLWQSNTVNNSVNTATLTVQGSLSVLNSSGTSIFSTPTKASSKRNIASPSNYIGCYKDNQTRTLEHNNGNRKTLSECELISSNKKDTYFGLQNATGNGLSECWSNTDYNKATKLGLATNCKKLPDGTWVGGVWSNAIYKNGEQNVPYFLILQDDGNMCIYKGSGPQDMQEIVWCSNTSNKQQEPNPTYRATNGKYGVNYINITSSLAVNDFIGSNDGSIYLIMQSDGNLVLYTSKKVSNCKQLKNGMLGGGSGANAIYKLNNVGVRDKLHKIAYIDQDSNSFVYPGSKISSTSTFNKVNAYNSDNQNIIGGSTSGGSLEACQALCNSNPKCYGVEYNTDIKTCYQKNNTIYSLKPTKLASPSANLYVKNKTVAEGFSTNSIDTIKLNNYANNNRVFSNDVVSTLSKQINSVDKQELEQLDSQLLLLSSQLNNTNNNVGNTIVNVDNKSTKTTKLHNLFTKQYYNNLNEINLINKDMPNYNSISDDSYIKNTASRYIFIMWCILFIVIMVIAIKVYRKF